MLNENEICNLEFESRLVFDKLLRGVDSKVIADKVFEEISKIDDTHLLALAFYTSYSFKNSSFHKDANKYDDPQKAFLVFNLILVNLIAEIYKGCVGYESFIKKLNNLKNTYLGGLSSNDAIRLQEMSCFINFSKVVVGVKNELDIILAKITGIHSRNFGDYGVLPLIIYDGFEVAIFLRNSDQQAGGSIAFGLEEHISKLVDANAVPLINSTITLVECLTLKLNVNYNDKILFEDCTKQVHRLVNNYMLSNLDIKERVKTYNLFI
jgi:hypothetical protein